MADVFLSYSSADRDVAEYLSEKLRKGGYSVFFDQNVLVSGEAITESITKSLDDAKAVVVLLSHNSQRSKWVERELTVALKKGGPVIPVLLDDEATDNWIWPLVSDRVAIKVGSRDEIPEAAQQIKDALDRSDINKVSVITRYRWILFSAAIIAVLIFALIRWLAK